MYDNINNTGLPQTQTHGWVSTGVRYIILMSCCVHWKMVSQIIRVGELDK